MNNIEFIDKIKKAQSNYKTAYALGTFGWPCNEKMIARMSKNVSNSKFIANCRKQMPDGFMFDCVCLIKAILWGWTGDSSKIYGGSKYASNGVPDIGANTIITKCNSISTNFSDIEIGELVWMDGHVGIYCGLLNGIPYCVECTAKWSKSVLRSSLGNVTKMSVDGHIRTWKRHGKLPYITYIDQPVTDTPIIPVKPTPQPVKYITYKVCSNDTLSKISNKFRLSLEKIYQLNKSLIDNENKRRNIPVNKMWIYPGQILKIKEMR